MKRALKITLVTVSVLLTLLLAALLYAIGVTAKVKLDPNKLVLHTACVTVFDGAGKEIQCGERITGVPYNEFPEALPHAFVAVEDKNFFSHHGFDIKRIGKAALKNIATFSFREGASTISQQLVKNTHLSGEKTISRKLKEWKLTRILEKHYSKEEIMELYLNSIYFGHSAFGIGQAARYYFDKSVPELTNAECATLAALVKSPNRYSPFKNAEKCRARRDLVLKLMLEQNYLSQNEYNEALLTPLPTTPTENGENAFLSYVYEELSELFPDAERSGMRLNVYTAYDPDLQAEIEKTKTESDLCVLVRDNRTNALKALHTTAGVLRRLPASVIKPLLVYAPALEENLITPLTPVLDKITDFGGYCPDDYGGATNKYLSVREAVAKSVNIPAVKILNELGVDKGAEYLKKMNLPLAEDDKSLALALGGMKEGFTLPELADAYAVFANGGTYTPSRAVLKVENEKGKNLYRFESKRVRVFSEDVSYLMSDMLQTTVKKGTARTLSSLPFPVCAKTGTGGTDAGNTDVYTLSYTFEDTVGVWLGNRDNSPVNATGGGLPANIAKSVWKYLYRNGAPNPLPVSSQVVEADYDLYEYENNHRILRADPLAPVFAKGSELFRKSALPEGTCTQFSNPTIQKPEICLKNGAVCIKLCQTQYYDYIIKRENRGVETTVYSGKYEQYLFDNSVRSGESYRYTVIPVYKDHLGTPVVLPRITVEKPKTLPDDWWDD